MAVLSWARPLQGAGKAAHDMLVTTGSSLCEPKEAHPTSSLIQDTPVANDSHLCMSTLPVGFN